jgi:nucleotide-binding universal stress UspA family protein
VLVVRARRDAPRHVLLAIDGSPEARAAIDLLAHLPLPSEARVTQLHVMTPDVDDRADALVMEHARVTLGRRVFDHDVADRGHIGEEVLHRALARGSDLIVLGTRGQTAGSGILRASIADHVLSHAPCAVLVAKTPLATRSVEAPARVATVPAF